jgi:thiol-disulfide isomerase/thioredoxin
VLEPSQLQSLDDSFEVNKEVVAKGAGDLRFFAAVFELLAEAGKKKAKAEEVRGWADKAFRAADANGPRWQRYVATQMARYLLDGGGFNDLALTYARRAERLLDPKAAPAERLQVLGALAAALKTADKTEELKEVEARLDKIDVSLKPAKFAGRKGKSDRAVLVELFTGSQCPPCVAADLAFDALGKTYTPAEVVLLEYHEHIPGPDALTNRDTEARLEYYQRAIEGTPTILLDGRPLDASGGGVDEAAGLYEAYREVLDEQLIERPAGAKLTAAAVRKGNKIDITAEATDVDRPNEPLRLRVALVEDEVSYVGGNQIRLHHHVVRAFPGGAEGLAIKGKTGKQAVTVDLDQLRKDLTKYLDEAAKKAEEDGQAFPKAGRPMELKNLKVVAFLQNDRTKEVVQAVQADVRAGE